jgi:hypothetical protein
MHAATLKKWLARSVDEPFTAQSQDISTSLGFKIEPNKPGQRSFLMQPLR